MPDSVHIVIGTKAQFIKMAPIAFLLEENKVPYRIIDLSQHGGLTKGIIEDFGLRPDILFFQPTGSNVATYSAAMHWSRRCVSQLMRSKKRLKDELLLTLNSIALVHGDTLSTLLGTYLAKKLGLLVGLVEAGLTSGKLFSPFPEEAIRRHVETRADFLFASGAQAGQHLRARRVPGSIIDTGYNTGRDAFLLMVSRIKRETAREAPFTLLTMHRSETIGRKARLRKLLQHVLQLAARLPPVRFYVHEPTLRALEAAGLIGLIRTQPRVSLLPLARYRDFVAALMQAEYILTDGGSIQEEASYLQTPCLILRPETERGEGIGSTAALTKLNAQEDLAFLLSASRPEKLPDFSFELRASRRVLEGIGIL